MAQPFVPLFLSNLRGWFGARGFWMVVLAALVPVGLTGAWAATHTSDVAIGAVTWTPADIVAGDNLILTAEVRNPGGRDIATVNVSLLIGEVLGEQFRQRAGDPQTLTDLKAGETRVITTNWTAAAGGWTFLAYADFEDALGEINEINNLELKTVVVKQRVENATRAPAAPGNLTGPSGAAALDVVVERVEWDAVAPGNRTELRAVVRNAGPSDLTNANVTVRLQDRGVIGNLRSVGGLTAPGARGSPPVFAGVNLSTGETRTFAVNWTSRAGAFWLDAFVNVTAQEDTNAANNHATLAFGVDAPLPKDPRPPNPPDEKATIKQFYVTILAGLYLPILVPLIALFYAGGVVADEKEKGHLVYLLTRPVERWMIPVTKFVAGFLVSAVAVVVGVAATYALLLGTGTEAKDIVFLATPLAMSLLTLFVYGAFFVLAGVLLERPYLGGVLFVLGWETVAARFVPFVQNLTLSRHVVNALQAWVSPEGDLLWSPAGEGVRALQTIVIAAFAFLVGAAILMRSREYEV